MDRTIPKKYLVLSRVRRNRPKKGLSTSLPEDHRFGFASISQASQEEKDAVAIGGYEGVEEFKCV